MNHVLTDDDAQSLIANETTAWEIVRLAFPDASRDFCDWFLWEKTPFPIVRGVHDIADAVAARFVRGPRCDEPTERDYDCNNRVRGWGRRCHLHEIEEAL